MFIHTQLVIGQISEHTTHLQPLLTGILADASSYGHCSRPSELLMDDISGSQYHPKIPSSFQIWHPSQQLLQACFHDCVTTTIARPEMEEGDQRFLLDIAPCDFQQC